MAAKMRLLEQSKQRLVEEKEIGARRLHETGQEVERLKELMKT